LILTLDEVKEFLKLEYDFYDEDNLLQLLMTASEAFLLNSTGITFDSSNSLAKLFCLVLISDWYDDRAIIGKASDKIRFTIDCISTQLKYCYGGDSA